MCVSKVKKMFVFRQRLRTYYFIFTIFVKVINKINSRLTFFREKIDSHLNLFFGVIYLVRTQNFQKTNISYPLIHTRICAYQGVLNVSFSETFAYVLKNE